MQAIGIEGIIPDMVIIEAITEGIDIDMDIITVGIDMDTISEATDMDTITEGIDIHIDTITGDIDLALDIIMVIRHSFWGAQECMMDPVARYRLKTEGC